MSVFTFDTRPDNPVTVQRLDEVCETLGVTIKEDEKESYRTLLAVYHEAAETLLSLPGRFLFKTFKGGYHSDMI